MKFTNPLSDEDYKERVKPREEDIRGPYFRDQTAIIHSLPYRRLKHKTQVFFSPKNDHVCTRIEHSLHVATIAATIARGLDLNEEMTYAIGLAHDLGHAPFGHSGERALNDLCGDIGGFVHELHGFRMVDKLGNRGKSLNLTYPIKNGKPRLRYQKQGLKGHSICSSLVKGSSNIQYNPIIISYIVWKIKYMAYR